MPQSTYELPRDASESQRLEAQHKIYTTSLGYTLHPSVSLPANARVADVATGTGIWMLEVAQSSPSGCTFDGIDISDSQFPSKHPSNCSFKVLNMLDPIPAELHGAYDLVHIRLLQLALRPQDWQTVASNALTMLKPGGALQWCEPSFPFAEVLQERSGASREAAAAIYDLVMSTLKKNGKLDGGADYLKDKLQQVGFGDLQEDLVSSDRVPELRKTATQVGVIVPLAGIARGLMKSSGANMPPSETVEQMIDRSYAETADGQVYFRWNIRVVLGRKPL